jgi:hypothetical protein
MGYDEDLRALLAPSHAAAFEMPGRPLQSWPRVATQRLVSERELATWVRPGVAFARSLLPKAR